MSKSIDGMPDQKTLGLVDISVNRSIVFCVSSLRLLAALITEFLETECKPSRNAYGSQVDSFESDLIADESVFGTEPLRAILIRAPMITKVAALAARIGLVRPLSRH